jgi:hypothetical protein
MEIVFERAKQEGLTAMDTFSSFRADKNVTRAEMSKIISLYATKFL